MDDTRPFRHGEEGTHYACPQMVQRLGDKVVCCGCNGHECKRANQTVTEPYWKCEQHNSVGNADLGCPHPSHRTRKQALADQVVKAFRSRDIENGWVDDYHYKEKMQEVEAFLRDQVGKAYDAGTKDKEAELIQIDE